MRLDHLNIKIQCVSLLKRVRLSLLCALEEGRRLCHRWKIHGVTDGRMSGAEESLRVQMYKLKNERF